VEKPARGLAPGQLGRVFENLVENAYTAGSGGALVTYLPVLDSRGVDRAVSAAGGPPLYLQVKGHIHPRRAQRLSFSIPLSQVGTYPRWLIVLVSGSAGGLADIYLVAGADLLRHSARGHLVDGRPCLRLTVSPTSPTWAPYRTPVVELGERLLRLAGPGLGVGPETPEEVAERQQEAGGYFEAATTAALLGGSDRLVLYRPAVDFSGRDLLVQQAGSSSYVYLQIKGTARLDIPDHAHFQVRRRTFVSDPQLVFVFAYRDPAGRLGPIWVVDGVELGERCPAGDPEHLSFEARIEGTDSRWGHRRLQPDGLAPELLRRLAQSAP
jgi:hypothetical protein